MIKRGVALILLAFLVTSCGAAGDGASQPVASATPPVASGTSRSTTASAPMATAAPQATVTTVHVTPGPAGTGEAASSPAAAGGAGAIRNPVLDRDFPDPDVIAAGDVYYAFATNADSMNIPVASSPDLVEWEFLGDALPRPPSWSGREFGYHWAPEVSRFDGNYVMYFVSRLPIGFGGLQCIALATSEQPAGPFVPTEQSNAEPFVCQQDEGGSIDPAVFTDDDGTSYLLWKSDANSRGGQAWIYIQPLAEDGMSLEGEPTRLITADTRWEGVLVEGPTLWKHEGKYYLFYSANDYRSRDYAVGYAVAEQPAGPYTKGAENPILQTNIGVGIIGPGGQDVAVGPDGKTYMLFHAWRPEAYRALAVAPLDWQDGVPVVTLPPRE